MKQMGKYFAVVFLTLFVWSVAAASPTAVFAAKADKAAKAPKAAATVNVAKMGDMSDFDPGNPVTPTGDTINIAVVAAFSGPSAYNGQIYYAMVQWVAHESTNAAAFWWTARKLIES